LGFAQLLSSGGSGYFPRGLVRRHLRSGRVREVGGAPTFPLAIYAAYPSAGDAELLAPALRGLRIVVARAVRGGETRRSRVPDARKVRGTRARGTSEGRASASGRHGRPG